MMSIKGRLFPRDDDELISSMPARSLKKRRRIARTPNP